jgi:hypothetical protein
MAQSLCEWKNRKAMMIDWGALVRAYQNYFDVRNTEFTQLTEKVIVFEKRLSECEIRFAAWQKK